MEKSFWIPCIVFATGLLILLLPDKTAPVFHFNKAHGPSLLDLIGLILILIAWWSTTITIVMRWRKVEKQVGPRGTYLLLILYVVFLGLIALALIASWEWLLWFSIIPAAVINALFIFFSFGRRS